MKNPDVTPKIRISLTTIFSLAVILFLPYLSIKTYFADSEIWSINLGYHFLEEFQNYWVFSRALFYLLIFSFTGPFSEPQSIFFAARTLMFLNSLVQLFILFRITNHYFRSRTANWLSILLVVANTFYLTQSYRVRSDLIATTVVLGTILALAKLKSPRQNLFIFLGGSLLSLLATPKAVFLLPVLTIVYLYNQNDMRKGKYILAIAAGLLLFYLSALFLRLGVLSDLVLDLHHYLQSSLRGDETGIPYFSKKSFTYVTKFFTENFWLAIIWLLPYLRIGKNTDKKWLAVHTYLLVLLFLAPEKLPFYICSLLPLLSCSTFILLGPLLTQKKRYLTSAITVGFTLMVFSMATWKILSFIHSDLNREQLVAVKDINHYLDTYPSIRYYDVIGLAPAHSKLRHFAGPSQPDTNKLVANIIANEKPEVLLRVAKFDYLGETLLNLLAKDYIHVGNGFYVSAFSLPPALQKEEEFLKIKDKSELLFLSPLFAKFQHEDLIIETKNEKGVRTVFSSLKNFQLNKPASKVTIIKVSPLPMPDKLPPRNLYDLFRFDTEF